MSLYAARIDPELVIWVVVVTFTLIAQLRRAVKQKPKPGTRIGAPRPRPPPQPRIPLPASEAQQELEDFLRNLTGVPTMTPERQPPPILEPSEEMPLETAPVLADLEPAPTPPPVLPVHHAGTMRSQFAEMTEEKKVPTELPPIHHPKALPLAIAIDDPYAVGRLSSAESRLHALRVMLRADLASPVALSKAIVLREIFDKPLALRRPANL